MGLDVYGRNPDSDAGKYFRANVWSWRPIHALIIELCSDLLDEDQLPLAGGQQGETDWMTRPDGRDVQYPHGFGLVCGVWTISGRVRR